MSFSGVLAVSWERIRGAALGRRGAALGRGSTSIDGICHLLARCLLVNGRLEELRFIDTSGASRRGGNMITGGECVVHSSGGGSAICGASGECRGGNGRITCGGSGEYRGERGDLERDPERCEWDN